MNAYSGSMWLDGVQIFQKAPLQVSFPMLPSAEISLFTDPEARAEIWVDDVALKIGSRLFAEYRPQETKLYYYLSDQISSTRMITDQTGTVEQALPATLGRLLALTHSGGLAYHHITRSNENVHQAHGRHYQRG